VFGSPKRNIEEGPSSTGGRVEGILRARSITPPSERE